MERLLGSDFPAFLATYGEPRTHGVRANPTKIEAAELASRLGMPLEPVPWAPEGFYYPGGARLGLHPYHAAGLYYMQEPSAMAAARALAPAPGERVLDLCAAPGGKSTHLAALMRFQGLLVANEIEPRRARVLIENLERLGVPCAVVTNERPDRLAARLPGYFDRILVDAPCSGEGMFRKQPATCAEWSPGFPGACARTQRQILSHAVRMLRPGGRLLYSTCTFAPEENEQVLLDLLRHHPEMRLIDLPPIPGAAPAEPDWTDDPDAARAHAIQRAVRLWPHRVRGEGHFLALLEKQDEGAASVGPSGSEWSGRPGKGGRGRPDWQDPAPREALQAYERFCREYLTDPPAGSPVLHGEWLYLPPRPLPDLSGLRVLRMGLLLGEVRKGRFEPAHALALALRPEAVRQVHDLPSGSEAVRAYLRGETLPAAGQSGWTLVTVDSFPLGWAKAVDGVLKNHYPKALRRVHAARRDDDPDEIE